MTLISVVLIVKFIREKKIDCGDYREVDIVPRTLSAEQYVRHGVRSKKKKESAPKQKNLNQKNARRYFRQLVNANFGRGDWFVSLSYSDKFLPTTLGQAQHEVANYLRRLKSLFKKNGLAFKYVLVNEGEERIGTTRINHHLIIQADKSKQITRDDIENLWSKRPIGEKRQQIGWANSKVIQSVAGGLESNESIINYLSKDPKGSKRWSSSRNLMRPVSRTNDHKYSSRKIERLSRQNDNGEEYFGQIYKDYQITEISFKYYELTGWHVYLKMWRH